METILEYSRLYSLSRFRTAIFLGASYAEAVVESIVWIPKFFGPEHPLIDLGMKHFVHKVLAITCWSVVILEHLYSFAFSLLGKWPFKVENIFGTLWLLVWLVGATHLISIDYAADLLHFLWHPRCWIVNNGFPVSGHRQRGHKGCKAELASRDTELWFTSIQKTYIENMIGYKCSFNKHLHILI